MTEENGKLGIGARVSAGRRRLGWTREELAVRSGLSWSAVAQVESGRRTNLRPATLAGLADALGVTIDYLVDRPAAPRPLFVHRALMYEGEESFVDLVGAFLAEGLEADEGAIAVTTAKKIELLRDRLGGEADRVLFRDSDRFYESPESAVANCRELLVRSLESGVPWVRAAGEPIWNGDGPHVMDWVRYESILNLAFAGAPATLLCPYDGAALDDEILRHAEATHPETVSAAGVTASGTFADPATVAVSQR